MPLFFDSGGGKYFFCPFRLSSSWINFIFYWSL